MHLTTMTTIKGDFSLHPITGKKPNAVALPKLLLFPCRLEVKWFALVNLK